jgi:endonuclease YncB( thermonuclease family)
MKNTLTTKKTYRKLLDDLASILEQGRLAALEAVAGIRNQTYWSMGERLARAKQAGQKESATDLIRELAADLGLTPSVLYRSLQFYHAYPEGLPDTPEVKRLNWAVHTELLPVKDPAERGFYMKKALEENWSARTLRRAVKSRLYDAENRRQRGESGYRLDRPGPGIYTYRAVPEKVVDGDTLDVRIDLGFDVWAVQRIRLRGIDTPEINTPEGRRATRFVKKAVGKLPFVVVRTYKTDKYARYVADLFYDPAGQDKQEVYLKGRFLNQELLDEGLAEPAFWG